MCTPTPMADAGEIVEASTKEFSDSRQHKNKIELKAAGESRLNGWKEPSGPAGQALNHPPSSANVESIVAVLAAGRRSFPT